MYGSDALLWLKKEMPAIRVVVGSLCIRRSDQRVEWVEEVFFGG